MDKYILKEFIENIPVTEGGLIGAFRSGRKVDKDPQVQKLMTEMRTLWRQAKSYEKENKYSNAITCQTKIIAICKKLHSIYDKNVENDGILDKVIGGANGMTGPSSFKDSVLKRITNQINISEKEIAKLKDKMR